VSKDVDAVGLRVVLPEAVAYAPGTTLGQLAPLRGLGRACWASRLPPVTDSRWRLWVMENLVRRLFVTIAAAAAVLLAAGCTAGHRSSGRIRGAVAPDPHTASALMKIAATFNHDYDTGDYVPVYSRWDARSQAIIIRADYIKRHKDCPGGPQTLSQTESVSPGGRRGRGWCITRSAASS